MKELYAVLGSDNETLMVFYSSAEGLCFKKMKNGEFLPYKIIEENMAEDFDAISTSQTVYVAGQDKSGNIILIKYSMGSWTKTILFQSKTQKSYPKQFRWVLAPEPVLFYTIKHQDKTMLVWYQLNAKPVVVDYIDPTMPITAAADGAYNIMVCYLAENGAGYRIIRTSIGELSDFYKFEEEVSDVEVIADSGEFYVAGISKTKYGSRVSFKVIDREARVIKMKVFENSIAIKGPTLYKAQNSIWVMWATSNQILGAKTNDNGENWSSPNRLLTLDATAALFKIRMDGANFNCYGKNSDTKPQLIVNNEVLSNPPKPKEIVREKTVELDIKEFAKENADAFQNKLDKNSISDYQASNYYEKKNKPLSANDFKAINQFDFEGYNSQELPFDIEREKERIKKELIAAEEANKNNKSKTSANNKIETNADKPKPKPKTEATAQKKAENGEYKKIISMLEGLTEKVERLEKKVNTKQKKLISYIENSGGDKKTKKTFSDIMKGIEDKNG